MRISFIIQKWSDDDDDCFVGGSAKSPFRLVKYLSRVCERRLVVYFQGRKSSMPGVVLCRVKGAKLFVKTLLQNVLAIRPVYRAFAESDVVQCHHPHYGISAAVLKQWVFKDKLFVVKAHGTAVPELKANNYKGLKGALLAWNARIHRHMDSFVLARADAVLCSSRFQEREMAALYGVNPAKLKTIYNGFDGDYFKAVGAVRTGDVKTIRVGFCGRLVSKKNVMYCLDVCEALVRAGRSVTLDLVLGDRHAIEDRQVYRQLMQRIEHVPFTVRVHQSLPESECARVLQGCDVGLVPSVGYESIPSVVYEFAAAGALVFATYEWGIPEILKPAYALTGRADEDAGKVVAAFVDRESSSLLRDVEEYSYQALVGDYMHLYESLSR
ncbi:MAG: glycosyltransferase [Alphaproteobacteria bacterium]|nr:MAG: glycosyltransferase [Alphaproteobacteria bacterium]